jgi:hypothetical protein
VCRYCAIGTGAAGGAFDDGTAVTTLINPQRDLADARTAFGINVSDVLVARLQEASRLLGAEIVSESMHLELDDIGSVLTPGVRICFTGTAQDSTGQRMSTWHGRRRSPRAVEGRGPTGAISRIVRQYCPVLVRTG